MSRFRNFACLAIPWLLLPGHPANGQTPSKRADAKAITALIAQLGSADFQERQAATKSLEAIGRPALAALREAADKHADAEVRRRAKGLVEKIENSLEQLLEDYKAYGLPLPPKDAPLVRFVPSYAIGEDGKETPNHDLGFLVKPATKDTGPVVLWGAWQSSPTRFKDVIVVDIQKPNQEIGVWAREGWAEDKVVLAVQCKERVWDSLAQQLFEIGQTTTRGRKPGTVVRRTAWYYWKGELSQPDSDRSVAARHLHALIALSKEIDTYENRALLKSLDAALVPSKAKPGSIEAMIDDLVDVSSLWFHSNPDPRYMRVNDAGFEAVPELIEHLDDIRLTRAYLSDIHGDGLHYEVRHLVSNLLESLAGDEVEVHGRVMDKEAARTWWSKAKRRGEEAQVVAHVLRKGDYFPETGLLRIIVKKYPHQLPNIYRTLLDREPQMPSWGMASALARSDAPREKKIELFSYAARHEKLYQRTPALEELVKLDHERFVQLLIETLDKLPKTLEKEGELGIAALVKETDDQRAWQALRRAVEKSEALLKLEMLKVVAEPSRDVRRKQRLALLSVFLDDASARVVANDPKPFESDYAGKGFPRLEVRNFAAMEIAQLLKNNRKPEPTWNDEQWTRYREEVRNALKR